MSDSRLPTSCIDGHDWGKGKLWLPADWTGLLEECDLYKVGSVSARYCKRCLGVFLEEAEEIEAYKGD